jgi:hypothetical protein
VDWSDWDREDYNYAQQAGGAGGRQGAGMRDPLSELCDDLPGLEAGDITALLCDLPMPILGDVPGMKVEKAIGILFCVHRGIHHGIYHGIFLDIHYCIYHGIYHDIYSDKHIMQCTIKYTVMYYNTLIHIILQLGLLPPLNVDNASVVSASAHIVQEHVKKIRLEQKRSRTSSRKFCITQTLTFRA